MNTVRALVTLLVVCVLCNECLSMQASELEYAVQDTTIIKQRGPSISQVVICDDMSGMPDCPYLVVAHVRWSPNDLEEDRMIRARNWKDLGHDPSRYNQWLKMKKEVEGNCTEYGANVIVFSSYSSVSSEVAHIRDTTFLASLWYVDTNMCPPGELWGTRVVNKEEQ